MSRSRRMNTFVVSPRHVCTALLALLTLVSSAPSIAQKGSAAPKGKRPTPAAAATSQTGPWLIKWKGGMVTLPEFESAFKRMNDRDAYATTLDSLKDFLGVYADYRLKLQQAKEEGLDKEPRILKEIEGYRQMLAGPYLLDKEVTEPALHQIFERRNYELRASHFLAYVRNWNDPQDTLRAYTKAMRAIQMLDQGFPMGYIAMAPGMRRLSQGDASVLRKKPTIDTSNMQDWPGSDDRATAKNGGDLGFFTAGMTVRPFENAVYALQPGEYTHVPVRTKFGYHVIYLQDRTPHTGGVHVKHILISMPVDIDTAPYYKRADSILTLIRNGQRFEDVARDNSDDKFTASKGGDFDTINHEDRRAEASFDLAANALKDGEVSGIVRTSFGYHIIKRVNGVTPRPYESIKDKLKQFYKNYYYDEDKDRYEAALHKQYGLSVDSSAINYFMSSVDSTKSSADSAWYARVTDRTRPIFRIGQTTWTIQALIDTMKSQAGAPLARNSVMEAVTKNLENATLNIATRDISSRYPEFDKIMEDYKNGIILFDMENKRVWSKVVPDSINERKFYEEHKAKFLWPERIDLSEIFTVSDSTAKALYKRIMAGENFDTLAARYTERPGFKAKAGHWGIMQKDENELARRAFNFIVDEVKEPFSFQGGYSIVRLNRRDPIHPKTFEEARPEVASQYQDDRAGELRNEWINELRAKYGRQINEPLVVSEWKKHHVQGAQSELLK